ncbi:MULTISPECIES: DMT family transporter [Streptomyces]|uniref:DMT family transporter n=1 Tax=Streptomyces TaxID=1883 RepID=UPI00163C8437|nr:MULTISPECIES: DMT family transporter [Streptomyces]MBC2878969.1 DMT family transporter [Streptomyces sp. TYQ1024]UBI40679.1 DMT family transporter [Streptomyces mobaraensis]UKW33262.1 DMT family transporter [Streptomyces sp. TYQ1024]
MADVLTLLFAVLAALSNATAVVLQRMAARTVPKADAFSLRLVRDLLRHPAWFAGIAAVLCAAVFQALALSLGSLSLVQPIFVSELPFALLIAGTVFRRRLPAYGWAAILLVAAGLGLALAAAAPGGAHVHVGTARWLAALTAAVAAMAACVAAALPRPRGKARAALFGAAAAVGYALTAALMKDAATTFARHGAGAFFTCWQTYAFAAAGAASLFLLSNAMESGPLLASQPALTLGDALVSLTLGLVVYEEHVRTGWWLIPEAVGALMIAAGALILPRVEEVALPS